MDLQDRTVYGDIFYKGYTITRISSRGTCTLREPGKTKNEQEYHSGVYPLGAHFCRCSDKLYASVEDAINHIDKLECNN
jgi:hypothetical protein